MSKESTIYTFLQRESSDIKHNDKYQEDGTYKQIGFLPS